MTKFEEIMEGPWINLSLHAESIPHLFHHDLAYLWVLDKQSDQRPTIWDERIEAWRYLVELLFIGELEVKPEPIRDPLLRYTSPYGITSVFWVSLRNSNEKIGVLSPTVLVRPLPDFATSDLKRWKEVLQQKQRPDEFRYFVRLAVEYVQEGQLEESFRYKLGQLLEKEFTPGAMDIPPFGTSSTSFRIPILRQLVWTQRLGEPDCVEEIELLVRGTGDRIPVYVPRCTAAGCRYLLTKLQGATPIEVVEDRFEVNCENPAGNHLNELPLSNFLMWIRNEEEVILWKRQGVLDLPTHGLPPLPIVQDTQVRFEWGAADVGGERDRRFLTLQFPDKRIIEHRIDDILFKKILVPGQSKEFSGLPVRYEWLDALEKPDQLKPEMAANMSKVTYREMMVKGWPVPISRVYSGKLNIHSEPELAVGVYPNPEYLPEKWQWYRIFLHGSGRHSFQIQMNPGKKIMSWLYETTKKLGSSVSVSLMGDSNTGTTYWVKAQHSNLASTSMTKLDLGIDFGTTNTIIYFLPPGKEMQDVKNNPAEFCLEPSKSYTLVKWLAEIDGTSVYKTVGDFLPGPEYRQDRRDPHIIPSDLWSFDDNFLIRWDVAFPNAKAQIKTGFKWDYGSVDRSAERIAFMKELLFLVLPSILKTIMDSGLITTWDLSFQLGFAFPLAFGAEARESAKKLHTKVRDNLKELTGFDFVLYSINESSACMLLLGRPNSTDTFLVADIGGGTIDVALFTEDKPIQIGSIRFAGETCLEAVSQKRAIDRQELRDLIAQGKCHRHYGGDQTAQMVLNRFIGITFEFLRTMIEAYRKEKPDQTIHLVLAGNGWHLVEAFSGQTQEKTAKQVFNDYYQVVVNRMGIEKIELSHPLSNLDSNKHLVAIGALNHVRHPASTGSYELGSTQPTVSQLPAGRGLRFGDSTKPVLEIKWSDLVGGKVLSTTMSSEDLRRIDSHIDFNDIPPLKPEWRSYLLGRFGIADEKQIPYPTELTLRQQLQDSIKEDPPRLTKGPLQIILEQHWTDWLKK